MHRKKLEKFFSEKKNQDEKMISKNVHQKKNNV